MLITASATVDEAERHLLDLGGGNHTDNMRQIRAHERLYRADLAEADFWQLVFLETATTARLTHANHARRLRVVAEAARALGYPRLGPNWDLHEIRDRTKAARAGLPHLRLPALLLRDARDGELQFGRWYLQDGSHRALGYATGLLDWNLRYTNQVVFLATNHAYEPGSAA